MNTTALSTDWEIVGTIPLPSSTLVELRAHDDPARKFIAPAPALLTVERYAIGPFGIGARETRVVVGALDPRTGAVEPLVADPPGTGPGVLVAIHAADQWLTDYLPPRTPPGGGGL